MSAADLSPVTLRARAAGNGSAGATKRAQYEACAAAGMTVAEAAKAMGVTPSMIWKSQRKYGVKFKGAKPRRIITEDVVLQALDLQRDGLTFSEIGRRLGFLGESIISAIQRHKDRAPLEAARSDGARIPDGNHAAGTVAPNDCVVLSLANVFGGDMVKAVEAASVYRKAQARKETSVAAPVPVIRVNQVPFRIGQSLHGQEHGASACKRPGEILPTNFGEVR